MQVVASELKETKAGNGLILKLTQEILKGPHANRKVFSNLNVQNPNETAERISKLALAALLIAVGLQSVRDSEELHFKPFRAKVGIQVDKTGQYGPQNFVVRYLPPEEIPFPPIAAPHLKPNLNGPTPAVAPNKPWNLPKPRV